MDINRGIFYKGVGPISVNLKGVWILGKGSYWPIEDLVMQRVEVIPIDDTIDVGLRDKILALSRKYNVNAKFRISDPPSQFMQSIPTVTVKVPLHEGYGRRVRE